MYIFVVMLEQGGHKPGIFSDFSEHDNSGNSANSVQPQGKIGTNKVF